MAPHPLIVQTAEEDRMRLMFSALPNASSTNSLMQTSQNILATNNISMCSSVTNLLPPNVK